MDVDERANRLDNTNHVGWTPLMRAVRNSNFEISKAHFDKVSFTEHGVSLLSITVASGNITNVCSILDSMDSYDEIRKSFVTPFLVAAYNGYNEIIRLLYNKWPREINSACIVTGMTPLMLAVLGKYRESVELLLSLGADCCVRNKLKRSAMDLAVVSDQSEIAQLLLSYCVHAKYENIINRVLIEPCPITNYSSPVQTRKLNSLFLLAGDNHGSSWSDEFHKSDGNDDDSDSGRSYFESSSQLGCFLTPSRNRRKKCKFRKILNNFTERKSKKKKLHKSMDMESLLKKLKLEDYSSYFADNEMDPETFFSLTNSDLEHIGIINISDRKRILKHLNGT